MNCLSLAVIHLFIKFTSRPFPKSSMQPLLPLSSLPRRFTSRLHPFTSSFPISPKRATFTSHPTPNTPILRHTTLARVEHILEYHFRNPSLLAEAMTHRSVMIRGKGRGFPCYETADGGLKEVKANYERLECVGDRVFGLVVVQALYERKKKATEGNISTQFHTLVSRDKAHHYCRYGRKFSLFAWFGVSSRHLGPEKLNVNCSRLMHSLPQGTWSGQTSIRERRATRKGRYTLRRHV